MKTCVAIRLKKDILYICTTKIQKVNQNMGIIQKDIQVKLTKGLLDLIILQLLNEQPMHGYEIITTIRKSFGVYFGASTIYPLLNTMEKKKYVKSEWNMDSERPRKVYRLTINGKTTLNFTVDSLSIICKTIGGDNKQASNEIKQTQFSVIQHREKEYNSPSIS